MEELPLPVGAEQLLRYFEGVDREHPGPHWQNGAEMCRRWLGLLAGNPSQADIDAFVARLEVEPNCGSGWLDLGMQFRHWARSRGFRA
jgi:hypothetical protein